MGTYPKPKYNLTEEEAFHLLKIRYERNPTYTYEDYVISISRKMGYSLYETRKGLEYHYVKFMKLISNKGQV